MAQQANVTLNTIVYSPNGTTNGKSTWTNRAGGFGNSFTNLTETFGQPVNGSAVKMTFLLEVPIVATVDTGFVAAGTLLRKCTVQISAFMASDSSAAERTDVYNRLKDLVLSAPVSNGIQNLDPTWG